MWRRAAAAPGRRLGAISAEAEKEEDTVAASSRVMCQERSFSASPGRPIGTLLGCVVAIVCLLCGCRWGSAGIGGLLAWCDWGSRYHGRYLYDLTQGALGRTRVPYRRLASHARNAPAGRWPSYFVAAANVRIRDPAPAAAHAKWWDCALPNACEINEPETI